MVRARKTKTVADLAELRGTTRHEEADELQRLDVQDTLRFDAASFAVDDGVDVVKPDDLLATQPGRWLKVKIDADDVTGITGGIIVSRYGDGSDGNVTINSQVTLDRDMYYDTLTLDPGGELLTDGFVIYCKTELIWNGGIIHADGGNGGNAVADTGGTAGVPRPNVGAGRGLFSTTIGGATGGRGQSTNGQAGSNPTPAAPALGALGGEGGDGGDSGGNTGGVAPTPTGTKDSVRAFLPTPNIHRIQSVRYPGQGGSGGGGGAGDGSNLGGGGGGGGAGGGAGWISAKKITFNSGAIRAKGGDGGDGANGSAGNAAGGGPGGPGAGGFIYIQYSEFAGTPFSPDVSGGQPGNPGIGSGTGLDGETIGIAGDNGVVCIVDLAGDRISTLGILPIP